jgi:AbrB family looped-hinge helix DNA binding protein
MPHATLTTKGQIVIPKPIRDRLQLHPGDSVDFLLQDDGEVLLRPAVEDVASLKGCLRSRRRTPVAVEAMHQAIRQRAGGKPAS